MRSIKYWVLILCIFVNLAFASGAFAEGTFTLEQILSPPYPMHLTAAKNADRIAWVFYIKGERNVWTAARPYFRPKNLTGFEKDEVFEIPDVRITDDGTKVLYVRGGRPDSKGWVTNSNSDPAGTEQAIWAVKSSGGKPWKIGLGSNPTPSPDGKKVLLEKDGQIFISSLRKPFLFLPKAKPKKLFKAAGRNSNPSWSPDGKRVAFVTYREDHSYIGVLNIEKKKITWMAPGVDRDTNPAWSSDGKQIAFLRRPGAQFGETFSFGDYPDTAIWIADVENGEGKELLHPPAEEPKFHSLRNLHLTANNRIIFTAEHPNWNHIYSMPLSGGEPLDLTPDEGFVEQVGLSSDGETVYFSSNLADIHGRHIWKVPTEGGDMVQLTKEATIGNYPQALSSGSKVAFLHATATYPTSIAMVPADSGETEIIAPRELPAEFPAEDLVIPELVIVRAPDGLEIPCQVFLPKDAKPGDKRPGVVYTHGGPIRQMLLGWHYMDFYSDAYGINQYFANKGYVVISINYRSGIGYGRSFRLAQNRGISGASEYQDLVAGARYLQRRPEVDAAKIGLWGLSYGGLLTAQGLARNSDIFKVGVDMAGVHDWSQFGRSRPGVFPAKTLKIAFESSPVAFVNRWKSPVLFIHGDDDRNVPFNQTTDLVQKLRAKGDVHVELFVCPDEPHEYLLYKNRMDAYNLTFEFLDRFLK